MTRKIGALLLAALMALTVNVSAFAAGASGPAIALEGAVSQDVTTLEVSLTGAEGATNGQIVVDYDAEKLTLQAVEPDGAILLTSVNSEDPGHVSFAWAASELGAGKCLMFTMTLKAKSGASGQAVYEAVARQLYDSGVSLLPEDAAVSTRVTLNVVNYPVVPPVQSGGSDESEEPVFSDLEGHWGRDVILEAYEKGWIEGMPDGTFAPEGNATRAQFATILWRMADKPAVSAGTAFTDLAEGAWYTDALNWAVSAGVMVGTSETTASPDKTITRQEAVTMLYRYAGTLGVDLSSDGSLDGFSDAGDVAPWAVEPMTWAVGHDVVVGTTEGTILGGRDITRAEMAAIIVRAAALV